MQIYEMGKAGLSYVNEPKQVVFTKDQVDIVRGVISGRFDVGFIRTNQIELTRDEDGDLIDPKLFKIIEPKIHVMDDGELFPFLHSTDIFPEWPIAALPNVPHDVQKAVQEALVDFGAHSTIGQMINDCKSSNNNGSCDFLSYRDDVRNAPCNASEDLALMAAEAAQKSHINAFRTARSYFELRSMQEKAGFLVQDENDDWYCTRPADLFDGITCPEGYFKRDREEFEKGCEQVGLDCDENENYDCFCKPCVKAFEVDVYEQTEGKQDPHLVDFFGESLPGCEKMSICGTIQQGERITLHIYDNMLRDGATVEVVAHVGDYRHNVPVENIPGTYAYKFSLTDDEVRVQVVDIMVNGAPISQSPVRVMVVPKDCEAYYGVKSNRVPNTIGNCVW